MDLTKRVTRTSLYPLRCFVCGGDMPSHVHHAPGKTLYFRRNLQTNRDARVCSEKCAKDCDTIRKALGETK